MALKHSMAMTFTNGLGGIFNEWEGRISSFSPRYSSNWIGRIGYKIFVTISLITGFSASCFSQEVDYIKADTAMATVYFVRTGNVSSAQEYYYFDNTTFLGKLSGVHAFVYQCDPGKHLFWVSTDRNDFVEGELKANSTYVIEIYQRNGVNLYPLKPNDAAPLQDVEFVLQKYGLSEPNPQEQVMAILEQGMSEYIKTKESVKRIPANAEFPNDWYKRLGATNNQSTTSANISSQRQFHDGWLESSVANTGHFGIGFGLPYGGLGLRLGFNPASGLNMFLGLGTMFAGFGINAGLRGEIKSSGQVQPYILAMYGSNAAIRVKGASDLNQVYFGPTLGAGLKINLRERPGNYFDLGVSFPIRSDEYKNDLNRLKRSASVTDFRDASTVLISIGLNLSMF